MRKIKRIGFLLGLLASFLLVFSGCETNGASNGASGSEGQLSQGIKDKYAATGPHAVAQSTATGFTIYHPRNMQGNHPIITWGNGTGAPTLSYGPFLRHLASWGFVVIASNSTMTGSGKQMIEGVDYLVKQDKQSGSKFFGMLDTENVGTTGHSQGGGGAINAATDPRVTCTVPFSPAPGSIRQVKCPTFMITGTADFLSSIVRSMSWAPAKAPTILGVLNGANHLTFIGNMGKTRGYVTAWFMAHMQGDQLAEKVFAEGGELSKDKDWTVQRKNF